MITTYVYAPGVPSLYHWCRSCSRYPALPQGATAVPPQQGRPCSECAAREAEGSCET
jgi:hypothetical protein